MLCESPLEKVSDLVWWMSLKGPFSQNYVIIYSVGPNLYNFLSSEENVFTFSKKKVSHVRLVKVSK